MEENPRGAGESDDVHELLTLMHEYDTKESLLKISKKEVEKLKTEVEKLRLEKNWCVDDKGQRIIPTANEQALDICQQIVLDPDLRKDVVKALRIKKIDLQSNINQLKEMCDALKGTVTDKKS